MTLPLRAEGSPAPTAPLDAPGVSGPLFLWLAVQLLALLLALSRLPLAAGYPQPAELRAVQVLVVVQVITAALTFPYLLRSASAAAVVATGVPLTSLAAVVSGTPARDAATSIAYVLTWIISLWAWNGPNARRWMAAVAALLTPGTLILFYLRLEFGPGAPGDATALAAQWSAASPPLGALQALRGAPTWHAWGLPTLLICAAVVRRAIVRRSGQLIHNF